MPRGRPKKIKEPDGNGLPPEEIREAVTPIVEAHVEVSKLDPSIPENKQRGLR